MANYNCNLTLHFKTKLLLYSRKKILWTFTNHLIEVAETRLAQLDLQKRYEIIWLSINTCLGGKVWRRYFLGRCFVYQTFVCFKTFGVG